MSGEPVITLTKDDLEELLRSKVDSFTISPLTAPGENYGSTMLLVNAVLLPAHNEVSIVAKMVSEFLHVREFFCFRDTVRKEIYVYLRVRPAFLAIQEEYNVPEDMFLDVIPRCYGARTSRGGGIDQPVDESSAILMENLKESGYQLVDRVVGLDLKHLEYTVIRLARFHATAVVLKLKKPDVFKDTVMKAAAEFKKGPKPGDENRPGPMGVVNSVSHLPAVNNHMDRIRRAMERKHESFKKGIPPEAREPFATFVHHDFWTNNMMFSYGGTNGETITGLKIFDFQMPSYGSPATDLLFLLYSSRTIDVTKEDCDKLIKLYHNEFTKWLELFGCDIQPFSYEKFLMEVEFERRGCFPHAFFILKISSIPTDRAPDLSSRSDHDRAIVDISGLGETYLKKVENLVNEFVERNWI